MELTVFHRTNQILQLLNKIINKEESIMTALDDLNAAVTTLTASVTAEIAALTAALANSDSAGIEAAVSNLNTLNSQIQASIPAPAPVTPSAS